MISLKPSREGDISDVPAEDVEQLDGHAIQHDCAPFIDFHPTGTGNKDGYVRLAHASAFVFLQELAQKTVTEAERISINSNLIAEACLKYLSQTRYRDTSLSSVRTHHFYTYAAKYWHRHMEEAGPDPHLLQSAMDFIRSTQFLTVTRFQGAFLNRHFGDRLMSRLKKTQDEKPLSASTGVSQHLAGKTDMQHLVDDYKHFISEWGDLLQLGTTCSAPDDLIESCFWGALGKQNALQMTGSAVEKNQSFMLETHTADGDARQDGDMLSKVDFYETISDDGSRVSVWQIPVERYD